MSFPRCPICGRLGPLVFEDGERVPPGRCRLCGAILAYEELPSTAGSRSRVMTNGVAGERLAAIELPAPVALANEGHGSHPEEAG